MLPPFALRLRRARRSMRATGGAAQALLIATQRNDVALARLLIDAGADVNDRDAIEDSPFLYAGAEGRVEILED